MKRILITGAHSFIGTNLETYLGRFPDRYETETLPMHGHTPDEYDFHGADAVVHVAAIVHQKNTKKLQPLYDSVNRELTLALAEKAKREGVKQFVFFSSIGVYGKVEGVIDGETPLDPKTRYDRSKTEAEQGIIPLADETFCATILRSPRKGQSRKARPSCAASAGLSRFRKPPLHDLDRHALRAGRNASRRAAFRDLFPAGPHAGLCERAHRAGDGGGGENTAQDEAVQPGDPGAVFSDAHR